MPTLLQRCYRTQSITLEMQPSSAIPDSMLRRIPQSLARSYLQDEPALVLDAARISTEGYYRITGELLSLCGHSEPTPYETAEQYQERLNLAGLQLSPPRRILIYGDSIPLLLGLLEVSREQLAPAS